MSADQRPHASLDLDALIERIKQEAGTLTIAAVPSGPPPAPETLAPLPDFPRFTEQLPTSCGFALTDLLAFSGERFLEEAYRAILGREIDSAGRAEYGDYLRRGGNRTFVIAVLLMSPEAAGNGVRVSGLHWVRRLRRVPGKRVLAPLFGVGEGVVRLFNRRLTTTEALSPLRAQLDETTRQLRGVLQERDALIGRMRGQLDAATDSLQSKASVDDVTAALDYRTLQEKVEATQVLAAAQQTTNESLHANIARIDAALGDRATTHQVEAVHAMATRDQQTIELLQGEIDRIGNAINDLAQTKTVDALQHDIFRIDSALADLARTQTVETVRALAVQNQRRLHMLRADLARLEMRPPAASATVSSPTTPPSETFGPALDAYYLAFEDSFRGAEADIKASLKHYLHDVEEAACITPDTPLLDLGCGRGEWLALLRDHDIAAAGADTSAAMVAHCRQCDLDVEQYDALSYLENLEDASLGAISAFHLIEHLPFPTLHRLLGRAYETLTPGGLLVLETPNPENVLVGSHTFYNDPTHRNPMTPTATRFLVEYFGFSATEIRRLHPYPEEAKVPGNDALTERVNGHLCGPQDFAIIARKPVTAT